MTDAERKLLIWCGVMLLRTKPFTYAEAEEIDHLIADVRAEARDPNWPEAAPLAPGGGSAGMMPAREGWREMNDDHDVIWLAPRCPRNPDEGWCEHDGRLEYGEGRLWCQDDVWGRCRTCGALPTRYIRDGKAAGTLE